MISLVLMILLPGRQPWEQSSTPAVSQTITETGQDQDGHVPRVQGEVRSDQHPGQEHGIQGEAGEWEGWRWWLTVQSDPTAINKLKAALSTSLATAQETGKKRRLEIWFSFWRSLRIYCEDIIFQWTNFLQQNKEQRQWSKMKKRWVIPTFVLDVSRVFDGFYAMM